MTFHRAGAILAMSAIVAGCGNEAPIESVHADTPVFVISIDTLRSDRLPIYGYQRGTTPSIDRFREDAILYRKAFSAVPLTLPSHATIFTGKLPYRHGVRDNIGYRIAEDEVTLGSVLKASGYRTGAAISSFVLRRETGADLGFDHYDDLVTEMAGETISSWQRDGDSTRQALVDWLEAEPGRNRSFGFLHLYEPHFPWDPSEIEGEDPYDAEVRRSDEIFGRFIEDLRRMDLYDRSLIVLLSDHGEGLGDHGEMEHGVFIYREAIQVPLLIKLPGNEKGGETSDAVVSLADVMPTILEVVGEPVPEEFDGIDILAEPTGERSVYAESWYPRLHYGWQELHSEVTDQYHLIDAPAVELYDYHADPGEAVNIATEQRRVVADLRRTLEERLAGTSFSGPAVESAEQVSRLQSLGYLGGGSSDYAVELPDPKEHIDTIARFGEGTRALQERDLDRAIAVGRSIIDENPNFLQAWGLISAAEKMRGNLEGAIAAMEEQMRRSPGNPQTALMLATLNLEARRFDGAATYAEIAAETSPSQGMEVLATVRLAKGDLEGAAEALRRAIDAGGRRVSLIIVESQIAERRKDWTAVLSSLDEIRGLIADGGSPPVRDLERRRGDALLQLGWPREAEDAFEQEVETFPDNVMAWSQLALVVHGAGRASESRAVIAEALRKNPGPRMRNLAREVFQITSDDEGLRMLDSRSSG
ncbi:MAG: sulfatase-like hydrolase/transferase [Acidobacteria bacterium]|nr:sulfatase-like hydrolase/transferase [Acidobacteriota bacterium]